MTNFLHAHGGRLGLVCFASLAVCIILLFTLEYSMGWIYFALSCGSMAAACFARAKWIQLVALLLMSLCIMLFVAETFLNMQNTSNSAQRLYNGKIRSPMVQRDPVMGYIPVPASMQTRVSKHLDGRVLYDTLHSTDAEGRRITPQNLDATTAILFFGCSFTAGEGVNDHETYPWVVAEMLGPQYQVFNLGVGGYGPHHFLALLQSGKLDPIFEKYYTTHVFFMNIASHELRCGGFSAWDVHGPHYVLENGRAVYKGSFADAAPLGARFSAALKRSELFRNILVEKMQWRRAELFALQEAILREARHTLQEKYPQAQLSLLIMPDAAQWMPSYQAAGFDLVDMKACLPDWPNPDRYEILGDKHPNAYAYKQIAKNIVEHITRTEQSSP